ncbi:hypothetical protein BCR43DRAFT_531475 [Syncephalastrum racemosum]|uniref:Uncharacterized protein n=1 Tax=Syncephalastrum racemosum TaxID=13706 RepID=A0A1X2HB86_SYNRA|nr:hypothetical protein BCR43DRAFT_531475 [Syncephalastrum racemosum]
MILVSGTLAAHTDYLKSATSVCQMPKDEDIRMKEVSIMSLCSVYGPDKIRFFDPKIEVWGMHSVTAQRRVKQCTMSPDSIFETRKQIGHKCIMTEEHKIVLVDFFDSNPSATVIDVTENLLKRFNDVRASGNTVVYDFMKNECSLLLKKADLHSIERKSPAKIGETCKQ